MLAAGIKENSRTCFLLLFHGGVFEYILPSMPHTQVRLLFHDVRVTLSINLKSLLRTSFFGFLNLREPGGIAKTRKIYGDTKIGFHECYLGILNSSSYFNGICISTLAFNKGPRGERGKRESHVTVYCNVVKHAKILTRCT